MIKVLTVFERYHSFYIICHVDVFRNQKKKEKVEGSDTHLVPL